MVTNPNISRTSAHPQGDLWCDAVKCELAQDGLASARSRVMNAGETMYGAGSVAFDSASWCERRSSRELRGCFVLSAVGPSIDLIAHPRPGACLPFEGHS